MCCCDLLIAFVLLHRLAQSVKLMIAIAIFFTFTLQFYVPVSIIWKGISHKISEERKNVSEYALRIALVVSTVIYIYIYFFLWNIYIRTHYIEDICKYSHPTYSTHR